MTLDNFQEKYQNISFNTTTEKELIDTLLDDVNELLDSLSDETNTGKLYEARDIINNYSMEIQSKTVYDDKGNAKNIMDNFSIKTLKLIRNISDNDLEIKTKSDMEYIQKKLDELRQP